jgi:alpha-L-fucosidase 2
MAAMVQGDIISERLQFNEESLWTGGPGGREAHVDQGSTTSSAYSFGYNSTSTNQDTIYNALKNGGTNSPGSGIPGMIQGNYNGYGRYKNFGYLNLDYKFPSGSTTVYDYRRELDLENGEARVQYRANNITYTREYIASYPDNTIAVRISADSGGKVNLGVSAIPGQPDGKIGTTIQQPTVTASNGTITLSGGLYDNGLLYTAVFKVDATGGSLTTDPTTATINIANADTVTIYFSAATDFKNEFKLSATNNFNDLKYRTGETLEQITARVASKLAPMSDSGYVSFKNKHRQDYKNLFDRVSFNIGGTNALPTDTAKDDYKKASNTVAPQHQMLETLMYQYGRYLLIASSREGSLPANLQGKWNNINNPPWCADYHTNINLQMNYWPAGGADLLETMEPLQKYTESLMVTGRYTAQKYSYPASTPADAWKEPGSGWATHVSGGIFGFTAPGTSWSWGWSPAANAFLCQNLYQYLQYGGDKETFKNDYWPIIREAAIMWTKSLYKPTDGLWAGKYVALPSYSPEHGPLTVATAYDQQLVWELFTIALDCLKQLDLESSDAALKANIEEKLNGLYPGIKIGTLGQIQEWSELPADNAGEGIGNHRHMSQMVGFYPGTSIANGNQTNFDAAKKTLELRGLGATGWSMGWKINLWARSKNASQTYRLVNNLLKDNTALNLFDLHDVRFQIDGNFGYTAGVQEMLLQSHLGALDLLPALPNAWAKGSIKGIRSIGGHKLNMSWDGSKLTSAEIEAFSDGNIKVRCASFDNATVKVDDSVVSVQDASITIAATKGRKYVVSVN